MNPNCVLLKITNIQSIIFSVILLKKWDTKKGTQIVHGSSTNNWRSLFFIKWQKWNYALNVSNLYIQREVFKFILKIGWKSGKHVPLQIITQDRPNWGGICPPPHFCKSVNLIPSEGGCRLCPLNYYLPPTPPPTRIFRYSASSVTSKSILSWL